MTDLEKNITFAPTVPVLLPVRSANGSFFMTTILYNTPPMPLSDAHSGGFFLSKNFT